MITEAAIVGTRLELLVDAAEFWQRLHADLTRARARIWIQTLSCEADSAGTPLAEELLASNCEDRRLLVDGFNDHIISDRFIYAPRNFVDPVLRAEVAGTRAMLRRLQAGGVRVGTTNPAGFLWHRLPSRDHRKLILIDDDVAYIGGLNFSEHNFAWHDFMIRIQDAEIAAFLRADFTATWSGEPVATVRHFGDIELHSLSGYGNEVRCRPALDVIRNARQSVLAITPYLTFPFTDALAEARTRGAEVTILSPATNNRRSLRRYVLWLAQRERFQVRHYLGRMSHLKAVLVDQETLIVGSSNFDWPTYHVLAETIAIIRDPAFVAEFNERVVVPDLAQSVLAEETVIELGGRFSEWQHRVWAWGARTVCRPRAGKRVRML